MTLGRGNYIKLDAVEVLASRSVGREPEELVADLGSTWVLLGSSIDVFPGGRGWAEMNG